MVRAWLGIAGIVGLGLLLGCSGEDIAFSKHRSTPTFHRDVEPIVQNHCQGCHVAGGLAPFPLTSYDDARTKAGLIATETRAGVMPPWGAVSTDDCTPQHGFKDDVRLSEEELETLEAWSKAGAPEGNPADAPPPREVTADSLPGVQQELAPPAPFTASGDSDQFICFVLDPKLTSDAFVNGTYVIPGNRSVVHHVVMFADPTRMTASLAGAGGFNCFGATTAQMGTTGLVPLGVWLPGGTPQELPADTGISMPAGSLIVMQIHYHPAGTEAAPDQTRLQLRYTASKPTYLLAPVGIGNYPAPFGDGDGLQPEPDDGPNGPAFLIPANVAGHVEEMQVTMPATQKDGSPWPDIRIYGAGAHMHLVGRDLEARVFRKNADGSESPECLLHEPHWDFDWQRTYAYDAPFDELPRLGPGDRLRIRCTYDNTLDNPFVQRALHDAHLSQPVDVKLGEQTLDEMCVLILPLIVRAP